MEIVVQERYQDIILVRIEAFYSSTCILLVFEFLISFFNVCVFTDYVKLIKGFSIIVIIIIIIIIIITSETGITIYNYKSHRKLVNVKGLKKKKNRLVCINLRPEYFSKYFCPEFQIGFITSMQ